MSVKISVAELTAIPQHEQVKWAVTNIGQKARVNMLHKAPNKIQDFPSLCLLNTLCNTTTNLERPGRSCYLSRSGIHTLCI